MNTTETSLLGDMQDIVQKKRRFHMLPVYCRVMVIIGSILGGFFTLSTTYFLFVAIFTGSIFHLRPALFNTFCIILTLTFCLGNALIWAEKKEAIGIGRAACICGMFVSFSFIGINFAQNLLLLFICPLPLIILYIMLYIKLGQISTVWKNEGISLQELRRLRN